MLPAFSLYNLPTRSGPSGIELLDACRRKWIALTPEEMVRQQLMQHLQQHCGVPTSLMAVEKGIMVGDRQRRFDCYAMLPNGKIWLLAECKAPNVALGSAALSQVLSYAAQLDCSFLLLSNGHENYCWAVENGETVLQIEWPIYPTKKAPTNG